LALALTGGFDWADPSTVPIPLLDYRNVTLKGLRIAMYTTNGIIDPTPETVDCIRRSAKALEEAGAVVEDRLPPELRTAWEITLEYWRFCGKQGTVEDYFKFQDRWDLFRKVSQEWMERWDLVLGPVEAYPAPRTEDRDRLPTFTYTAPASLLGWPSAVVRAGASKEGLPIGVQFTAAPWRDEVALAAASYVESVLGGYRPPSIAITS
jgi:amidase